MKTRIVPAIYLKLKPSYWILGWYVLVSMLSLISLVLVTLPLLLKCAIAVTVIIAIIYTILQDVLLCLPWSWQLVEVTSHGQVRLHNQRGDMIKVMMLVSTVSHPRLTILRFKRLAYQYGLRNSLMITPWNAEEPQQYRKLRVWLNWGKPNTATHQTLDVLAE